jgi:N-acetylglucosamine-6-phosphate deacetylase
MLAGSTVTMIESVRRVHALGVPLPEAVAAAASVPARIAGKPVGSLAAGSAADVVVLDDRLEVRRVLVGGVEVFGGC